MINIFASIVAAALLGTAPVPVQPQANDGERRASVRYADLDLSSPAGKRAFERRMARATAKLCGSYAGAGDSEEREIRECRAQIAAARASRDEALVASR